MVGVFTDQFNEKVGENTNLRQNIFALQMLIISSAVCKTAPAGRTTETNSFCYKHLTFSRSIKTKIEIQRKNDTEGITC
jgi:hypothetical protein